MQFIDRIASLDNHIIDNLSNSLYSRFDVWLTSHPLLYWLFNHSLVSLIFSLVAIVLIVRLLLTIYRSIASTIDKMWLWILRSPFILLKLLFGWEVKSQDDSANTTITNYEVTNNPEKMQEIMSRLEQIQLQQQQIVQDISWLKQQFIHVDTAEISLQPMPKELPPSMTEK